MPDTHSAAYRAFLKRLQVARQEAELTQIEVAEALEVPQSQVSRMESGERRVDVVELQQLAKVYGKPVSFFLPD